MVERAKGFIDWLFTHAESAFNWILAKAEQLVRIAELAVRIAAILASAFATAKVAFA